MFALVGVLVEASVLQISDRRSRGRSRCGWEDRATDVFGRGWLD